MNYFGSDEVVEELQTFRFEWEESLKQMDLFVAKTGGMNGVTRKMDWRSCLASSTLLFGFETTPNG